MSENFEPNTLVPQISRTPWQDFWHHFRRNRPAVIGIFVVMMLALVAASASIGTTGTGTEGTWQAQPNATNVDAQFVPPFSYGNIKRTEKDEHGTVITRMEKKFYLLGSDDLGRDNFLRLWTGSTVSLLVGFVSVGISVIIGILVGGIAGFYGRGKVTLPFLICVLGPPLAMLVSTFRFMNGIEWGLSIALYALAGLAFVAILSGAVIGRAWRTLVIFGVMACLSFVFFVVPKLMESQGAAGSALELHRDSLKGIVSVREEYRNALEPTGAFERAKAELETGQAGANQKKVDDAAEAAGRAQAKVEAASARLEVVRARASLASAEAAIEDAERIIRAEEAKGTLPDSTDEEARIGALKGANAVKDTNTKLLPARKKSLEDAEKALATSLQTLVIPIGRLKNTDKLQDEKAKKNQLKAAHQAAEKKSLELLLNTSTLYALTQKLPLLILVGFLTVLAFMLLAYAGQTGARRVPELNALFVPIITVDNFAMRSVEVLMTMPTLVLLLTIMAFYERDVWLVMFVIGILSWMGTARFVRAEILSLRERDFISAAKSLGLSDAAIILRHLIPNALSPVLVSATIGVAAAIILESTLSFLGLGASPEQVTWGKMLADSRQYITHAPWLFVTPAIAILIVVLAFNLLGEGMREAMNPKLRKR